jgi:RNA polymerase sigma-70 factor, ECF subfamily
MLQIRVPAWRERWLPFYATYLGTTARAFLASRFLALGRGDASGPVSRTAAGAETARQAQFDHWFEQYRLPLLDYLYGMTRDRESAADLVQETFLRAYASANDPEAIAQPRPWLYRIATNTAFTVLQRRKRFTWLPLTVVEPTGGANSSDRWTRPELPQMIGQDIAATVVERDAVWRTLAELPPRWRSVLLLQAAGGFEVREIATQLHLSEPNVRKILRRAKERFRTLHAQLDAADQIRLAQGGPQ